MKFNRDAHPAYIARGRATFEDLSDAEFYRILSLMAETKDYGGHSRYYAFGYQVFGAILYGFCKWMMNDLRKQGIDRILFYSRDGYIIQRAFDLIPGHEDFRADYVYVSRRSLCVPQLWAVEPEMRSESISMTKYITIGDLLTSLGLEKERYVDTVLAHQLGMDYIAKDVDFASGGSLTGFLDDIWPDVVENSKREFSLAIEYLDQFNNDSRTAVVDIGWRGSIQKSMESLIRLAGNKVELRGYYLALNTSMHRGLNMRGYLMDMNGGDVGCDLLRGLVGLAELMFLKPEGSTEKYEKAIDGSVVPVLYPYEYWEDGDYSAEAKAVIDLQSGALDFVREYVELGEPVKFITSSVAFRNLLAFASHPNMEAIDMFGWFRFYNNGTVSTLTGSNTFLFNITHLGDMKRDLYGSRWRIGFLKRMLVIPLPYDAIFKVMMKAAM